MRALTILGCASLGLSLAVGCGGESSDDDGGVAASAGDAGAPASSSTGGGGRGSGVQAGEGGEAGDESTGGTVAAGGRAPTAGGAAGGNAAGGIAGGAGGKAAGGATVGGGPVVGEVPLPDECEATSELVGDATCNLDLNCRGNRLSVICNHGSEDDWYCYCNGLVTMSYDVVSETSGTACAVATALCTGNGPNLEELPADCSTEESPTDGYCTVTEICSREVEIDDVPTVTVRDERTTYCTQDGAIARCQCGHGDEEIYPEFEGIDVSDGCAFAAAFCSSSMRVPTGDLDCMPQSMGSSPNACILERSCGMPVELDDGSVVSVHTAQYIDCTPSDDGRSICYCTDAFGSFAFDLLDSPGPDTCATGVELCGRQSEVEFGEMLECGSASQMLNGDECDLYLDCVQAASVGTTDIVLRGFIQGTCYEDGGGFACSCFSGGDQTTSETITTDAESAWDACTVAVEECPKVVNLAVESL